MKGEIKLLYRSKDNKIFAGILGGLGEYLSIDPTVLRALYILLTVFTGIILGIIAYIISIFVIPASPDKN